MSEKPLPFVITDRRKFNPDGQPREGADTSPAAEPTAPADPFPAVPEPAAPPASSAAANVVEMPAPSAETEPTPQHAPEPLQFPGASQFEDPAASESDLPPSPTPEQMAQSERAFQATVERLDLAIRAANPGADHPPALTFESLVQSVYMQAVLQLGGGTQHNEPPQVDILGARQSIDMLSIIAAKTAGNLSRSEETLLSSALFELRLAFLEMTQALARSAQQRNPPPPGGSPPATPGRSGPSLIR